MKVENRWKRSRDGHGRAEGQQIAPWQMGDTAPSAEAQLPSLLPQTAHVGGWHNVKAWGSRNDSSAPEVAPVSLDATAWFLNLQDHVTNYVSLSPDQSAFDAEFISHMDILETGHISCQN